MKRMPFRPHMDHFRQEAKDLLKQMRTAAEEGADQVKLSTAQAAVARKYGHGSWPELVSWTGRMRQVEAELRKFPMAGRRFLEGVVREKRLADIDLLNAGAVEHPNPRIRGDCLALLDHVAGEESVPVYVSALSDPVPNVRRRALHALTCETCKAETLCADIVPEVVRLALHEPNEMVRVQAVHALLVRQSDQRAREALAAVAAGDAHEGIRRYAAGHRPAHKGWKPILRNEFRTGTPARMPCPGAGA